MIRHYIWPHSWKMNSKFTCSCRVEIPTGNTKNTLWNFKGTSIHVSATRLHACIFFTAAAMFVFGSTENHVFEIHVKL